MKRNFFMVSIFCFFTAIGFFLSSCSIETDSSENIDGKKYVHLKAASEDGSVTFSKRNSSARTILPDALTGSDYNYFLIYKGATQTTESIEQIDFQAESTDDTKGTFQKDFPVDSYNMFLYAVKNDRTEITAASTKADIQGAAVLAAYTHADLRYADKVSFYLTANKIVGDASYSLKIINDTAFTVPSGYTISVGLYGYDDDQLKDPTPVQNVTRNADGSFSTTLANAGFTSGNYNLKVIFTNTATNKTYSYSELVVLMANRSTTRDNTNPVIVPDVLEKAPSRPADFVVGYTSPDSVAKDMYEVEFAWTDSSYREDGFELDLMKVDNIGATDSFPAFPETDAEWDALKAIYATDATKIFDDVYYKTQGNDITAGCEAWRNGYDNVQILTLNKQNLGSFRDSLADGGNTNTDGGSLNMNSTHVKLLLPLGHRFVARIRATNGAGESDYTYLRMFNPGDDLKTHSCTKGDALDAADATKVVEKTTAEYTLSSTNAFNDGVETINLYRLHYYIGDGTFKDATADTVVSPSLIQYKSQHSASGAASTTECAILSPNAKIADTSVTPNIVAVTGTDNTPSATGISGQTGDIKLQLRKEINFWKGWRCDSDDGDAYPTTGDPKVSDVYTGYKSLDLFADYTQFVAASGNIAVEEMTRYEIKPSFIEVGLFDNKTDQNAVTTVTSSTITLSNAAKIPLGSSEQIISQSEIGYITFKLDATVALYSKTKTGTADTPINYDSFSVEMHKVNGGDVVYNKTIEDFTEVCGINLAGRAGGKFALKISAKKGSYTYELTPNLILDVVQ